MTNDTMHVYAIHNQNNKSANLTQNTLMVFVVNSMVMTIQGP